MEQIYSFTTNKKDVGLKIGDFCRVEQIKESFIQNFGEEPFYEKTISFIIKEPFLEKEGLIESPKMSIPSQYIQPQNEEIWKVIKKNPHYEVSNFGNVRKKKDHTLLKLKDESARSNVRVWLLYGRRRKKLLSVHRLVAEAFLDNPFNYHFVIRKDGNYKNNRADNLKYVKTLTETYRASVTMSNAQTNPGTIPSRYIMNSKDEIFESIADAANTYNLQPSSISRALSGLQKKAGGLEWVFV